MEHLIDSAPMGKAARTPQGFLAAPATLAAAGIVVYNRPDGTKFREYRPPSEVLKQDSIDSYRNAPVTNGHPRQFPHLVTEKNSRQLLVGMVGDSIEKGDNVLNGRVIITDDEAIADVEQGKAALSPGYTRTLDPTPGVVGDEMPDLKGQAYDGVQRDIRCNHIALCERGRQGPKVRLQLDDQSQEDAVLVCDSVEFEKIQEDSHMKTVTINGKQYQVDDVVAARLDELEKAGPAAETANADLQAKLDAAVSEKDKIQAKADKAEKDLKDATARLDEAGSPKGPKERVKARARLIAVATQVLPKDHKLALDDADETEIMKAIIVADDEKADLKDKSADYIQARYDAIAVDLKERLDQDDEVARILGEGRKETKTDAETKLDEAREKSRKKLLDAHKTPMGTFRKES